jgi:hypothetical protein
MGRLRILIDPAHEAGLSAPQAMEVASDADYYRSRALLRDWRPGCAVQVIWVTSGAMASRYDDLLGDARFEVIRYSPRVLLCEALGAASLPEIISDKMIAECSLLQMAQSHPPHGGEVPEDWCLRVTLGPCWRSAAPSRDRLPDVLDSLCRTTDGHWSLKDLVTWRLRQWAAPHIDGGVFTWLAEDPFVRARCLASCWAVRGYGEVARQWVEQDGTEPEVVQAAWGLAEDLPPSMRACAGAVSPLIDAQIRHELGTCLEREGVAALARARACTPGEMRVAYEYVRRRIEGGEGCTADEADRIVTWANQREGNTLAQRLALAVRLSTEIPMPAPLGADATWEEAAVWLETGYFAGYQPRAVTGRLDETVQQVESFEKWLCSNYRLLVTNTEAGLHCFVGSSPIANPDGVTALVLLDGVPAPLGRYLRERLGGRGQLDVISEGLRLALLPTLTPTNRECLLSGRLPDQAVGSGLADLCGALGGDAREARAVDRLDASISPDPGEILFVHWRAVDEELLHKSMGSLDRWLRACSELDKLAEGVSAFVDEANARNLPVLIGFISDHGWTELPDDAPVVAVPEELAAQCTHRRVIQGAAEPTCGVDLPRHEYFLPSDTTLASGYSCLDRRPHGAVHGGATPQETVVFGFWATTIATASPADLGVSVLGTVRRAVSGNAVTLRIVNPNGEPVIVHQIALERLSLTEHTVPVQVGASGAAELRVLCDASDATGPVAVAGSVAWSTQSGRRRRQPVALSVATTGAAESDSAFEGMFDA